MQPIQKGNQTETMSNLTSQSPEFIMLQKKHPSDQENCESIEIDLDINSDDKNQKEQQKELEIDPSLEKLIYQKFLYKVFDILLLMWIIFLIFVITTIASDSLQEFMHDNFWLFYVCIALLIGIAVILYCYRSVAKKVPYNYYMLFGFTFLISYIFGYLCSEVSITSLLTVSGSAILLIVCLFIYSLKTQTDVTYKACSIGYSVFAVILVAICLLSYKDKIIHTLVALVLIGAFSFFLVFDLQKLRGKFHKSYEIDDYIIAALDIYIDTVLILNFFLQTTNE